MSRIYGAKRALRELHYLDKKRALLRAVYVRYADDWVLFCNGSRKYVVQIKDRIAAFLEVELGLSLSQDKTKITNVKFDRVKFLGFSLSYFAKKVKVSRISFNARSHTRRSTGNRLVVGIDQDRLNFRLRTKRFMSETKFWGCKKPEWTVLSDYEIVMRYNYCIRGLINYYGDMMRDFSHLNLYISVFNYSCAHTLACKHRSSIRKVMGKYGWPITAHQKVLGGGDADLKSITLLNYQSCKAMLSERKEVTSDSDAVDFLQVRINWRTAYKLQKHCVICGSSDRLEMHHIRHVKNSGIEEGFKKVISNINRKQICVCHACHSKIHRGLYDGLALIDLYDPELATL